MPVSAPACRRARRDLPHAPSPEALRSRAPLGLAPAPPAAALRPQPALWLPSPAQAMAFTGHGQPPGGRAASAPADLPQPRRRTARRFRTIPTRAGRACRAASGSCFRRIPRDRIPRPRRADSLSPCHRGAAATGKREEGGAGNSGREAAAAARACPDRQLPPARPPPLLQPSLAPSCAAMVPGKQAATVAPAALRVRGVAAFAFREPAARKAIVSGPEWTARFRTAGLRRRAAGSGAPAAHPSPERPGRFPARRRRRGFPAWKSSPLFRSGAAAPMHRRGRLRNICESPVGTLAALAERRLDGKWSCRGA